MRFPILFSSCMSFLYAVPPAWAQSKLPASEQEVTSWIDQAHAFRTTGRLAEADSILSVVITRNHSPLAYYERAQVELSRSDSAAYCEDLYQALVMKSPAVRTAYKHDCLTSDSARFRAFGLDSLRFPGILNVSRTCDRHDSGCAFMLYSADDSLRASFRLIGTDTLFMTSDASPEFPGGLSAMYTFLARNIRYPDAEMEAGIVGKVYVEFRVERNGRLTGHRVLRSVSPGLDAEALRSLRAMPSWKPGSWKGHPERFIYTMPVNFRLQ